VTDEPEEEVQILNESTALAWAAEGLIDSYAIAKEKQDVDQMLKIAEAWMKMSDMLGTIGSSQEESTQGTGHYL
jgi:hypothetical protein